MAGRPAARLPAAGRRRRSRGRTAAAPDRLAQLVDALGREAGIYLWYLAIVGGSAWKMEACLTRFCRQHLADVLPDEQGGAQVLLRGLPGTQPVSAGHAVQSADWYHPVAAELSTTPRPPPTDGPRHAQLAEQRAAAEQACRAALAGQPRLLAEFEQLLQVNQRYAVIREEQARDFTLAWPVLRTCVRRLGEHLTSTGVLPQPDGRGRPRTRPGRMLADKAYSSKAIRTHLRRRKIKAVIPEPADQIKNRAKRGSRGGRPPAFDKQAYKLRNTVERAINKLRQNRAVATRYDCEDGATTPGLLA